MLEFRGATEEDREQLAQVVGLAFNYLANPQDLVLDGTTCAVEGGRVVASCAVVPFQQWIGQRQVSCAGIAAVVVLPEHRGRGLASKLVKEALSAQRGQGQAVSALYPANAGLYRKLGYEYGGLMPVHTVPTTELPRRPGVELREAGASDAPSLMACFSKYLSAHNGPVETGDEAYFLSRVLAHKHEGRFQRAILVEGQDGAVEGFASYFTGDAGQGTYRLTCKQLVSLTSTAMAALLSYFTRFENAAKEFAWHGPPGDPLMGLALSSNGFSVTTEQYRWMERLLDVPVALAERGYPPVEGEVALEVDDPLFPENRGPWLIRARDSRAEVTASAGPALRIGVGPLSALYTGFARPGDLVLLGELDADASQLAALQRLFGGPLPWSPHFF